jgi:hypothetical protein
VKSRRRRGRDVPRLARLQCVATRTKPVRPDRRALADECDGDRIDVDESKVLRRGMTAFAVYCSQR